MVDVVLRWMVELANLNVDATDWVCVLRTKTDVLKESGYILSCHIVMYFLSESHCQSHCSQANGSITFLSLKQIFSQNIIIFCKMLNFSFNVIL